MQLRHTTIRRLLIVADDRRMREALMESLRERGYEVDAVADACNALGALARRQYDLALIDLLLGDMRGLGLIRSLRDSGASLRIMVVSRLSGMQERVACLDAGADDYLVKPFQMLELEARIRALLRTVVSDSHGGHLVFSSTQARVRVNGVAFDLKPKEFALLELLASRPGKALSKESIASRFPSPDGAPSDAAIELRIHRLRRRLAPYGLQIQVIRGFGYRLEVDGAQRLSGLVKR